MNRIGGMGGHSPKPKIFRLPNTTINSGRKYTQISFKEVPKPKFDKVPGEKLNFTGQKEEASSKASMNIVSNVNKLSTKINTLSQNSAHQLSDIQAYLASLKSDANEYKEVPVWLKHEIEITEKL
jgi:hypothetical protein